MVEFLADLLHVFKSLFCSFIAGITLGFSTTYRCLKLDLELELLGEQSVELVSLGCYGGENSSDQVGGGIRDGTGDVRLWHTQMGSEIAYVYPRSRHLVR